MGEVMSGDEEAPVPWAQKPSGEPGPEADPQERVFQVRARPVVALGLLIAGALGGVLGGIFGGAIEDVFRPDVAKAIHGYIENDEPVRIKNYEPTASGDMWLPSPASLSEQDLEEIAATDPVGHSVLLANKGAVLVGPLEVRVLLTGNRAGGVRITDLRPVSDCSRTNTGSLLVMAPPIGGTVTTHRMTINVENPNEPPKEFVPANEITPGTAGDNFFDKQHITLAEGEQEFFLIQLEAPTSLCSVDLEVTVLDGGEEHKQRLLGPGHEVKMVAANMYNQTQTVEHLYAGGDMCWKYVELPLSQVQGPWGRDACGPNNFSPYWERLEFDTTRRATTPTPAPTTEQSVPVPAAEASDPAL